MKKVRVPVLLSMCILFVAFTSCKEDIDTTQRQLASDIKAIDSYLAGIGADAYKDISGVRFVINSLGNDWLPPKRNQTVKFIYTAKLLSNGTVVDRDVLVQEQLGGLTVLGLIEGLEVLPAGTKATLYVPSSLAYGNKQVDLIPPNANLIYEVELLEVKPTASEISQFKIDTAAVNEYIEENDIDAEYGSFGIRYVIQEEGEGDFPFWYDKLKINYTGKLMSTGAAFFSGTVQPTSDFDSRVVDYLPGLQAMFQTLPENTKATLYIPSVFGFGSKGTGDGIVPANANLIYELESFEIVN